jgi:glycosyltransferase involved in cell wall biosynthesis
LSRAVYSVLNQAFTAEDFEVVVVNDSGQPLPEADWQRSDRVQVIHTNRRERSVARNTGAASARGRYLHFLDDDDWLLPGALENLWALARASDAAWLYGGAQLVDRRGKPIIQLHHGMNGNCFVQMIAGEWIPLQASLIQAEMFFAIGGFNPLLSVSEDVDLCRRVALCGDMAGTSATVACIGMGVESSSTDYVRAAASSRWAREKILSEPGVFARMRASANSNYWHGRIARAYLTSAVWNLRRRRVFTAASRATFGLTSFVLAGRHVCFKDFWRAVTQRYESEAFLKGFQEENRPVERREIPLGNGLSSKHTRGDSTWQRFLSTGVSSKPPPSSLDR